MKPAQAAAAPLIRFRTTKSKGFKPSEEPRIVRDGGDYGAGLIRGFSMITRGEALGHEMWIDGEFLDQVAAASSAAGKRGLKVRFTHPGLSSDGLGKFLGRVKFGRRDGEQVFGDLHFSKSSHETPDGDLAKYVMDMAEEHPEDFGASIVFKHDRQASRDFESKHQEEFDDGFDRETGQPRKSKRFKSPDKNNTRNLRHARLAALHATDIVDDPAANPDGLFHRNSLADDASALAAFALGLPGAERPSLSALDMDPDRIAAFAKRFLDRNGLTIVPKQKDDTPMSTANPAPAANDKPAEPTRDQLRAEAAAEAKRFTTKFGAKGAEWFGQGLTYEQALEKHTEELSAANAQLQKDKEEGAAQLAALDRGETTPAGSTGTDAGAGGKKSFASLFRVGGTPAK